MPCSLDTDKPREECGVLGIHAPGKEAARIGVFGLHALQHRGQEAAGMASSDGRTAHLHKAMGLVNQAFTEVNLEALPGHMCIGHTRYSTTGSSRLENAQPFLLETMIGPLGVAHNGNLTSAPSLRRELLNEGVGLSTSSDSELLIQLLTRGEGTMVDRLRMVMERVEGAYSLTVLTRDGVYGARDPWGFRPLCIGQFPDGGTVLASESCALATMGAEFIREVAPGEIIHLSDDGFAAKPGVPPRASAMCSFEHIYFARPDSVFGGRLLHSIRQNLGRRLARENPVDADAVISVPDSGTPAAIGYALESGLPFTEGLTKNRYIARTFIQPTQEQRRNAVKLKFNPLPANLKGKRIVAIDDSIVRGTTMGPLIQMLRDGGAAEVHIRISSPPIRHSCYMGVDMGARENLVAANLSVEETRQKIGADSLAYLSVEGLMQELHTGTHKSYCGACFHGNYDLHIPEEAGKEGLSGVLG